MRKKNEWTWRNVKFKKDTIQEIWQPMLIETYSIKTSQHVIFIGAQHLESFVVLCAVTPTAVSPWVRTVTTLL